MVTDKLKELNIELPKAPDPVGAYVAFKKINNFLYISGQLPISSDGKMIKGKIGKDLTTEDGQKAYRIVKIRKKTIAHTANLIEDYDKIRNVALQEKKQETINKWLEEKIARTYIKLEEELQDCTFNNKWIIQ